MKYGIDMGHTLTGVDYGAVGIRPESDLTREVGNRVISELQALGHTVVNCTCDSASSLGESLAYRVNTANTNNVDLLVSIHFNCFNTSAYGTEVFTYGGKSFAEAVNILNNICALGYTNRGIKDGRDLYVIKNTNMEAMLIECCFCDNADDMSKYNAESMANAIVEGLTGQSIKPINIDTSYDEARPTGENIYPIGKHSYIEETFDGRLIIHKDRGNYIAIGQGFVDLYWNDNNGNSGSKRLSE